jgi:hypothetical protein
MYRKNNNILSQIDILALAGVGLAVWGLFLNYRNMNENEQQTQSLKDHLENQDNDYLKTSIEQNNLIIQQNKDILARL